jgi:hypothetical protein
MHRRKPIRFRDVMLAIAVSAFFIPATVFPYIRRKALEDEEIVKKRRIASQQKP